MTGEIASQAGSPGAAALDTDSDDLAMPLEPLEEPPIAVPGRGEALRPLDTSEVVDDGGDVDVLVGVNPADHPAVLRLRDRGHGHLSFVNG
jgi:hypothetical protein